MATEAQIARAASHFRASLERTHGELREMRVTLTDIADQLLSDGKAGASARILTEVAILTRMITGLGADMDGEPWPAS